MSSKRVDFMNENSRFPPKTRHLKKIVLNFMLTRVGLLFTVCLYLLVGAFLFQCLESKHELKQQGLMQQQKMNCLKELWIITEKLNVLYAKNWTQLAYQHIRNYEKHISELTIDSNGFEDVLNPDRRWTFIRSFHYSLSLMTTIGNAGLSPKTLHGKLFTIFYAILGMPLMFLLLSHCGYVIANRLKLICLKLNWYFYYERPKTTWNRRIEEPTMSIVPTAKQTIIELRNGNGAPTTVLASRTNNTCCREFETIRLNDLKPSKSKENPLSLKDFKSVSSCSNTQSNYAEPVRFISTEVPALLAILLLLSYINIGSFTMAMWKNYSFLDASYFWFFSLTTIGQKADHNYVPSNETNHSLNVNFVCYICIFTIFGLILMASVFIMFIDKNFLRFNVICSSFQKEQNVSL